MVRPVRAWLDNQGTLHVSREDACKADFRRLMEARFNPSARGLVPLDDIIEAMFELDAMIGQATREDSSAKLVA